MSKNALKVALIGASGRVGSRLLKELSERGHSVTAISRHPEQISTLAGVTPVKCDLYQPTELANVLNGHDAVISSVFFTQSSFDDLISAVRKSGVKRYLVVGGAGSLDVAPGKPLIEQPDFPVEYKAESSAGFEFLKQLRQVKDIDWTFLSPSAMFVPGKRTGKFRLGKDQLLSNDEGSSISFEDFAVAMVDELETPQHTGERFTVGY